jgi:hypothetical protein
LKIHDIIEHFAGFTTVPVDPDMVAEQVKSAGLRDDITFVGVDIDVLALRGALHTHVVRDGVYGEPQICSDIYYALNQTRAWRRLVCCKELLHILDNTVSKTSTAEEFESLVKGLCSGAASRSFNTDALHVLADQLMIYYAIAIVFPFQVREAILLARATKQIDDATVAKWLDIPEEVCSLVMSSGWVNLYKALLGNR